MGHAHPNGNGHQRNGVAIVQLWNWVGVAWRDRCERYRLHRRTLGARVIGTLAVRDGDVLTRSVAAAQCLVLALAAVVEMGTGRRGALIITEGHHFDIVNKRDVAAVVHDALNSAPGLTFVAW